MLVVGFDPGSAITGYGVVEGRGSRLHHVEHGVFRTSADLPMAERLLSIHTRAFRLLESYRPDAVAIERLYFKQNVSTGINVAQARGVLLLAAAQAGCPAGEFSPTEMKTAITGYGRAEKSQLQEMVRRLLNLEDIPRPDDAADALALAICQLQIGNVQSRIQTRI
ncbi:MAG TPA: crossover junction endodeoxyribonuclease RuvC [Candidatus Hydrogenedentes bacterium]|jgi:crossover junction endodeoxyribonuclease RuvC|nr:crossover junction endodeoxyribonuclease RuvC [Candidatus Hydrogenedentota bacterium]